MTRRPNKLEAQPPDVENGPPRNYLAERQEAAKRREEELAAITTFHKFLQGVIPEGVMVRRFQKMNSAQAFTVIWFLQEVCHLFPDHYEMCDNCNVIYDAWAEGRYDDNKGRCYCDSCDPSSE